MHRHVCTRIQNTFKALFFPKRLTEILLEGLSELPTSPIPAPFCIAHTPFPIYSLGKYDHPVWHALIYEIKFYKNKHAIQLLAPVIKHSLNSDRLSLSEPLILPIPLYPAREKKRGFNQVSIVLRAAQIDIREDILQRTLQRKQQKTLNRTEREKNIAGSFEVPAHKQTALIGRHIILVDDVCATGSTVREAARTVTRAGALSVTILAFCNS